MKRRLLIMLCAFWALPTLNGVAAEYIPVDGFAASVNNRVITVGEVMSALQPIERQLRTVYSGRALMSRLEDAYHSVLDSMIENALILEEFERKDGRIPSQLVDEHIQGIIAENFQGDRGAFMRQLAEEGISMEEWRRDVRDRLAVMFLRREQVLPNVVVSPRQVRDEYERRLEEFTEPGGVRVRMIALPREATTEIPQPEVLAERLRAEAADGTDFSELARTYSQDARAERGGDWGWIDPGILRSELADVVTALASGAVSDVVDTGDQLYIVKVEDRRAPSVTPFSEVRDQLTEEVRRIEEDRIYRAWINRLKERHHVYRHELSRSEMRF